MFVSDNDAKHWCPKTSELVDSWRYDQSICWFLVTANYSCSGGAANEKQAFFLYLRSKTNFTTQKHTGQF